ncbi:hypothetical protein YC2023_066387 [Brassica napus]
MWAVCSVHTGRPWVSVNTHITSMCVRQHKQDVRGFPCVSVSTHRTSVVAISTHISTLVLGLSTLALPVNCSGDFGPRGLSVQYTQDVRGCPPVHTGRPWLSVCVLLCRSVHTGRLWLSIIHTGRPWVSPSTHRTSVAVCGYPSAHTGHPWLSISTHINTLVLGLSMLALPVDCLGDFGPRGLSVQYTQDVYGCPPAHTGCPWLSVTIFSTHRTSVAVCVCPCVSVSTRWTSMAVRVCPTLALPVDCLGDFGQRGLSVQYTHGVHGCLPTHTGRLRLSVSTHMTSVAVSVCPCVSITTDMMSVAVHQYTYEHAGPWTQHAGPSRGLFGTHRTSVAVRVCLCVSVSTHRTSVAVHQYTYQHVVHTGRLWVSASTHRTSVAVRVCPSVSVITHRRSVAAHQYTYQHYTQDVRGCPPAHTGRPWLSVAICQHTQDVSGCLCASVCVRVCPSAHTRCPWVSVSTHRTSVGVHVCPLAHTGRPWLSMSTHNSTLVLGLSTLALPVDCLGDFGPHGQSVHYTHDVCWCSPAHIGRPWLSVSTHRTSVAVRYTQDVRGCPSAHTGRPCVSISTHINTLVLGLSMLALPVDCLGDFGPRGLSVQYTQNVYGCPPAHTGCPWLSVTIVSTHRTSVAVCVCPCVSVSTRWTSMGVRQHTQDVSVCPSAHPGRPWLSVCVRVCLSAHTERLWLSISTHISTLVLGLSTLALPVDCLGDFGQRGLSVQYTHGVHGCLPTHTGRLRLSVSTHRTSMAVSVCPCVSITTDMMSVAVHQYTYEHAGPWTQHAGPSRGLFGTSVAVRVCLCVSVSTHRTSVAVHQYTYQHVVHTGRLWVSASTHRTSVAVRVCPSVSVSTHMRSVAVHQYTYQHYTQDVRGCPPAHTGRPWLSVAIRQHTQDVSGCLCASVCVRVCPSAHTRRPWVSVSTHRTSVGVCVCPLAHTGRPLLSMSTHNSTLVLGLSTLALPVDCLGDFGPHGQSVHYTHDVCWCSPAHIGRPWLSVSTHRTSVAVRYTQDVRGCPSAHTGRPCVSVSTHRTSVAVRVCPCVLVSTHRTSVAAISTHIRTLVLGLSTLALPVDCLGGFGPRGLSVQYTQGVRGLCQHTQDVCGCPSAHTGRLWLFVCVRVCPSPHTGCPWVSISTHISTLVLGLSTLALPVDCSGDFGLDGLSVQYTQDGRGCSSAHTRRLCVSVSTHRTSVAVRVCLCVSVSTHAMSVPVHQYTYQHVGPWTKHADPSRGLFGTFVAVRVCPSVSVSTHRTSVAVHQYTYQHVGSLTQHAALPVDNLGDFGPRGLSVQYTQDVRWCPPAHTGRPWLSVAIRQHTRDVRGCMCVSVCVGVCSSAHTGRPWVSVSTHKMSVGVRVWPSAHTGHLWLSISTHNSTLVLGLSTLGLLVDCLGDFGPRGQSVQYTQGVRGCLPAHTGCPRLSVSTHKTSYTQDVSGCSSAHTRRLCMSVSTHRTSVAVHQYTYQHVVHTGHPWVSASTHRTSVAVRVCPSLSVSTHKMTYTHDVRGCPPAHTGRPWLSVAIRQHTQDVRGCLCVSVCVRVCPSAHTRRLWVSVSTHRMSVGVRVCPSAHTGRPWLSISTHNSTLVLGLSTLTLPVDYSGDFGPRGLVCSVHTRRPWVSASTHRTFVAVRVCPSVSVSTHRTSMAVHQYTYQHVGSLTQHAALPVDNLGDFGPRGLSVQYTQDVRWCPPAHTGRPWLSVAIRQHTRDVRGCMCVSVCVGVCSSAHTGRPWVSVSTHKMSVGVRVWPSAHTGRLWLSISTHNSTLVLGLSTLGLLVDCLGDFGPRGQSVQYTQGVRGCLPAHTGCPRLSVSTHKTSVAVCVCLCVSTTTHRMSVAVHQYTYQHAGPSRGLFGHRTSVAVHQYTYQHVVHTGHPWVSASTHRTSVAVRVCPSVSVSTHKMTYTQDVRGCPPAHTGRSWLSVAIRQHTQDVRGCLCVSVCVRVCLSAHTRRLWVSVSTHRMSVGVRVCPSAHTGRPWLSISTHNSTLVLGLSMLALPVDCLGDFGLRGQSVQYTHDICGCPPAHIGRLWLSVSTHRTSVAVRVCLCVSVCVLSTHRTSVAIHQYTYQHAVHTGRPWVYVTTHRTSVCVRQHTQDVRVCPSAHTGRPFVSVQTGRPCVSVSTHRTSVAVRVCACVSVSTHRTSVAAISTHISTLVLGLSTLALPVDCLGDFGPRGLSVQYTQGVRGCLPAHTGRPRLSVSTNRTSVAVCVCPCVSMTTHRMSVAVHQYIYQHAGPSRGLFGTHRTSVAVRVCLCVSVSTHRTSVAVHQYTYQHVGPWTQHADPSRGLFG